MSLGMQLGLQYNIRNGFKGILDELGNVSNAVYTFPPYNRLTNNYSGKKLDIKRLSDNSTDTIYTDDFDGDGNINQSELEIWSQSGDIIVKKVYGEVYNSNAYQSDDNKCPKIVVSGSFENNGLDFDGVDDYLVVEDDGLSTYLSNFSMYCKFRNNVLGDKRILTKTMSAGNYSYSFTTRGTGNYWATVRVASGYKGNLSDIVADTNVNRLAMKFNGSSLKRYKNGVVYSDVSALGDIQYSSDDLIIGAHSAASGEFLNGSIKSILMFNSATIAVENLEI